jgi:hypothetical protein
LGEDTPDSPACTTVVASKITAELLKHAPATVLHPSGTHMLLRGFTGKNVHECTLDIPARADRVQAAFFHRPRNDTSLMNSSPSMSMLDSPMQPFMNEDLLHTRWVPFLMKSHLDLLQDWDQTCVLRGTDVCERKVCGNNQFGNIVLSDMYRSLNPAKLPCKDTLLYGIFYPIVGAGVKHVTGLNTWTTVNGWVHLRDAQHSEIHLFHSDVVMPDEVPMVGDDDDGNEIPHVSDLRCGDDGCAGFHDSFHTKDVFAALSSKGLLVQPVVNRPGAVLYSMDYRCFGLLEFNLQTGQCYNPTDGMYTMRIPHAAAAVESSVDQIDKNELKISPLQLELMLLCVPTSVLVDTQAFVIDGVPDRMLPEGAASSSYLRCNLWYPGDMAMYDEDHVYLLAHSGGSNSSSYTLIHCNVSYLVHPDYQDPAWDVHTSIRSVD